MVTILNEEEIAKHNNEESCWLVLQGKVYDVTPFLAKHPGGKKVILAKAGKDASAIFDSMHSPTVLAQYGDELFIGNVGEVQSKKETVSVLAKYDEVKQRAIALGAKEERIFGDMVPFGDPAWYQDWNSPYYTATHYKLRVKLREFVETEVMPHVHEWDEAKTLPRDLHRRVAASGFSAAAVGPPWPVEYVGNADILGIIRPAEWNCFHEFISIDEISRTGSAGITWGLSTGLAIGLPPVLKFASKPLRDRIVGPCLAGEKIICLAITEPYAGSDVASLQCRAELTPDGKHYIVNGEKKWITNGTFADYFTTAVRTGGPGMEGLSFILIEREFGGVTTRHIPCTGAWSSGTAYITFEDVKVPVGNLIGEEGKGFKYIVANFNHERWALCVQANRFSRVCLEDAMKYANKRKTFGKTLNSHPVIRQKLGLMAAKIETVHAWIESITYQMCTMERREQMLKLGGPIALCKAQTTQTLEFCAREAGQIFGGLSYTRGGQGERVERIGREVKAFVIPGGSEEIMVDLGVRQSMMFMKMMSNL